MRLRTGQPPSLLSRAAGVALAAALVLGCRMQGASRPTQAAAALALAGKVRDAVSGAPLHGAKVTLSLDSGAAITVRTDRKGGFSFRPSRAGQAALRVDVADAMPVERTVVLRRGHPLELDLFVFRPASAGQVAPPVDLRTGIVVRYFTDPALGGRGAIEGIATEEATGSALAGAAITLFDESRDLGTATVTAVADERGRFAIENLRPGSYTMSVYYQVVGRASIENRRSHLAIRPGHRLFLELEIDARTP